MKFLTALAATAVLALAGSNATAAIINLDALDDNGIVLTLGPGTYDLSVVGTAGGGAYDAWNAWGNVSGCDGQGENCATGFLVTYAVDFGANGVFNKTNGYQVTPTVRNIFDSAIDALTAFNTRPIQQCGFGAACNVLAGHTTTFMLASEQDVNFLILDTPYFDNSSGVSLDLTLRPTGGIPEPATWALMIGGFGLAGTALRAKRRLQRAAA